MSSGQLVTPLWAPRIVGPSLRTVVSLPARMLTRARDVPMEHWFAAYFAGCFIAFIVILFTEPSSVPIAGR